MWKESLRYQTPNLDTMSGIRRLTLNDNPHIGNNGSKLLCEVLRDDRWVKAIDLQNCGLGDSAGQAWLNLLKAPAKGLKGTGEMAGNRTLGIVDLRRNKKMDRNILRAVTERVLTNSHGKHLEFKWLRALARPANRGRVSDWPGMEGVLRLDLDSPQPPKRTSSTNPTYQPKPIPVARPLQRPNFRPPGGPLTSRPLFQTRAQSLPRLASGTQPPQPAPRLITRQSRLSRSASASAQNTPWKVGLTRITSVYLGGDDESNYNNNLQDENVIVRGIPWRTAARARRNTDTTVNFSQCQIKGVGQGSTRSYEDIEQDGLGEFKTIHKRNILATLIVTVNPKKFITLQFEYCLTPSANTSAKGTSSRGKGDPPEIRLRQQLRKHMHKRLENTEEPKTESLRDLYSRLNATLSEVEKVVKTLANSRKSKLATKSEEEQLFFIQTALRSIMTPLRCQMTADKVNQTASKANQRRISSSYTHNQKKIGKPTRDLTSGTSTRSTKYSTKKVNGNQREKRGYKHPRPKPRVANSARQKEDNPSSTTSLSDVFIARPARAINLLLGDSPRSDVHAKEERTCVELFDDFPSSKVQETSEVKSKAPHSGLNMRCGDVVEGETLYSDY
ncbi:unnamed protein product [Hydatigera taeniaeformis]|uniref:Centrosomal protein of 78 kDa n=1 Tax=Hydatigena taeniaeformis TaxID=6205 RepID=A0A0R3WIZ9_HYDTA|nr:unnamed protein product [Hydatigera taeniaeformis]